jgi:hypothetical protein
MSFVKSVRAVILFFYRFVVGDDPTAAVVMLVALGLTGALIGRGINAWWLVPPTAVVMTAASLWRRAQSSAAR